MKLLSFLLQRSRTVVAQALLASLINGAASTLLIYWINRLITGASGNSAVDFSVPVYAGLLALVFISGVAAQILLIRLTAKAVRDLRLHLSESILALPLVRIEALGINRLYAALTHDVSAIANTLGALPMLSFHVAIILGGLSYLGWLSWRWLLAVLAVIAFAVVVYEVLAGRARRLMKEHRHEQDTLYRHFNALLTGTKELKLNLRRRRHFVERSLNPTATRLRDKYQSAYSAWAVGANWANLLAFLLVGALALLYYAGIGGLRLPVLTAFVLTLLFLRAHFGGALNLIPALVQGEVALKKIDDLGLSVVTGPDSTSDEVQDDWRQLSLDEVRFSYPVDDGSDSFSVGPLSLSFTPAEIVFLTGGNGSGKSTVAKLVTGLYAPDAGRISFDEVAVTGKNLDWYRQHFSAVFSDFFLLDELVSDKPAALRDEVKGYLDKLELAHKVSLQDNQRLSTTDLSSGQRKRLALLGAYIENRAIYLFDEWAADQDPHFKHVFYEQLLPQLKARGKTVLVISHDERYFHVADRVLKFEDGRLINSSSAAAAALATT